jgi:hypothetical protein
MDGDGVEYYQTLEVLGSGRFGVVKKVMRRSNREVSHFFKAPFTVHSFADSSGRTSAIAA